ncbi:hypothetical protein P9944_25740, partial [Serratia nevei]|nr:hypothetical protein [Serratia nevei]
LCHGTVCVVGKMRDLILQLSKSSIYSTKPGFATKIVIAKTRFKTAQRPSPRLCITHAIVTSVYKPRSYTEA